MIKTDIRPITIEQLRTKISGFEATYGVPSSRLVEAFTRDGALVETDDFHEWSQLVTTLEAVAATRR